jgi:hypothetical protein
MKKKAATKNAAFFVTFATEIDFGIIYNSLWYNTRSN